MENQRTSVAALLPIMGAVFIGFLIVGMAMPVLPLHVHQDLGLGIFVVGLVAGSQFAAQLVTRVTSWAANWLPATRPTTKMPRPRSWWTCRGNTGIAMPTIRKPIKTAPMMGSKAATEVRWFSMDDRVASGEPPIK